MLKNKIGIFDSGFGGLTVMRALRQRLPKENLLYFGDTARLPYGNKSPETILRYSLENAQFLSQQEIKLLVIACHTSCCTALSQVRQSLNVPIVGITEGALDETSRRFPHGKVAILGTRATIASRFYQEELARQNPSLQLFPIACPLFVPLVEEGFIDHPLTALAINHYLHPLVQEQIDGALLCCTHYPLLLPALQQELGKRVELGKSVQIIDPAIACAEKIAALLAESDLLNTSSTAGMSSFFVSDDPEKFRHFGARFLGEEIQDVELVRGVEIMSETN